MKNLSTKSGAKGLKGEPMGGHNFGTSELQEKNNQDASDSRRPSLSLGNSVLK